MTEDQKKTLAEIRALEARGWGMWDAKPDDAQAEAQRAAEAKAEADAAELKAKSDAMRAGHACAHKNPGQWDKADIASVRSEILSVLKRGW